MLNYPNQPILSFCEYRLAIPCLSQATYGFLASEDGCSSDSTCGVSLDAESLQEITWTLEWLREAKVGMLPQCRANWQNYTAQPARKVGGC